MKFELSTDDDALIGDDIQIIVRVRNYSNSERTLSGRITLSSMYYTGTRHKAIGYMEIDDKVVDSGKSKLTFSSQRARLTGISSHVNFLLAPVTRWSVQTFSITYIA